MEKEPLVSIITPCYNDANYILECIRCVDSIKYPNIEHIIVNDGSTDALTCTQLNNIVQNEKRIVINKINEGVCIARQEGVANSRGKYILPLDADDLISNNYISLAISLLEENSNIKLVVTDYSLFGEINRTIKLEKYSLTKLLGHNLFGNSSIFRRIDFDQSGGYSINMKDGLEDWDFWIKLLSNGGDVYKIAGINYFYRIKKSKFSRNAQISSEMHKSLRKQIWENNKAVFSKVFLDPLETFEYMKVAQSKEYRLGSLLLSPIRKLLKK